MGPESANLACPLCPSRGGGQKLDFQSKASQANRGIFQRFPRCLRKFFWVRHDHWLDERGPRQHKDPNFEPQKTKKKGAKFSNFGTKVSKTPFSSAIFEFCATKPQTSFSNHKKNQVLRTPCGQRFLRWGFKIGTKIPRAPQPWLQKNLQTSPREGRGGMAECCICDPICPKPIAEIFQGTSKSLRKFFHAQIGCCLDKIWPQQHRNVQNRPQKGKKIALKVGSKDCIWISKNAHLWRIFLVSYACGFQFFSSSLKAKVAIYCAGDLAWHEISPSSTAIVCKNVTSLPPPLGGGQDAKNGIFKPEFPFQPQKSQSVT